MVARKQEDEYPAQARTIFRNLIKHMVKFPNNITLHSFALSLSLFITIQASCLALSASQLTEDPSHSGSKQIIFSAQHFANMAVSKELSFHELLQTSLLPATQDGQIEKPLLYQTSVREEN